MNASAYPLEAAMAVPTPHTVTSLDILRAIRDGGSWPTKVAMAQAFGRNDGPNMTKTLKILHEDGVLTGWEDSKALALTDYGQHVVESFDRTQRERAPAGHAWVRLDRIRPNPNNPREDFTSPSARADLEGLKASIQVAGIQQNPLARPPGEDGVYTLVFGECRWRMCRELQAEGTYGPDHEILLKVEALSDEDADNLAFIENKARRNLNYVEEAKAFRHMEQAYGWSHDRIAAEWGYDKKTVQDRLRLLDLPQEVHDQLNAGEITWREARALFQVPKEHKEPEPGLFQADGSQPGDKFQEPASRAADDPPVLDLSAKAALIVAELADAADRNPVVGMEPGWARIDAIPEGGAAEELVRRQIVMFKSGDRNAAGLGPFAKVLIHSSGANYWLEKHGFYDGPTFRKVWLDGLRADAVGEAKAQRALEDGGYVTPWLNVADDGQDGAKPPYQGPLREALGMPEPEGGVPLEPGSAPSPAAKADEPLTPMRAAQLDAKVITEMARDLNERAGNWRLNQSRPHWSKRPVEELARELTGFMQRGEITNVLLAMACLRDRAGGDYDSAQPIQDALAAWANPTEG